MLCPGRSWKWRPHKLQQVGVELMVWTFEIDHQRWPIATSCFIISNWMTITFMVSMRCNKNEIDVWSRKISDSIESMFADVFQFSLFDIRLREQVSEFWSSQTLSETGFWVGHWFLISVSWRHRLASEVIIVCYNGMGFTIALPGATSNKCCPHLLIHL